jgi:haloalkane dehalogenase
VDAYRTPDEQFDGLPGYDFEPRYVEQDGLRLHYLDEGDGPPVLLLHGEPTWSYLYRKVIPELTAAARAIAPDYLGFGRSDKPLARETYTYDFHVRSIARLVEELDLRDATVVVQDWGGPVGLRVATENPDRFARLVIMNTGIGGGRPPSEEWLRFRDWLRRLGTDVIPGRLVQISAVQPMADEVVEAYSAPWPVPESKQAILAFPDLVPISPDHPDLAAHNAVKDALSRWEKPALVLFSDSDPIFSPRVAERIAAHIPGAGEAEIVAGAGHFLQEDQGPAIGRRVAEFVASTSSASTE